jgi:ADP-heptose:LPS heptosyltransferase
MADPTTLAAARAMPARLAIAMRRAVFVPGGPLEDVYQRLVRPWGRHLLPRPGPAVLGRVGTWPSPAQPPAAIRELLVVKLDHIGDFMLAAPAFAALRRFFPRARITLLCGPWNTGLAEASGYFDRVVPFRFFAARAEEQRPIIDQAALAALGCFDLAIDLRVDPDTRPVLGMVRASRAAAYAAPDAGFLTLALPQPDPDPDARDTLENHTRQRLMDLVGAVLAQDFDQETAAMIRRFATPVEATSWPRPVVAFNTGSGRAIKNWPIARFIDLGRRLRARGATLLLLGTQDQAEDAALLRAALGEDGVIDLVGRLKLDASLGALAAADAYVGNDTAMGHAAAALGKPTVVLFSGIDPLPCWAPLGPNAHVIKAEVGCSPCHLSDLSLCPNGHLCMTAITVHKVWYVLSELLPPQTPRRPPVRANEHAAVL